MPLILNFSGNDFFSSLLVQTIDQFFGLKVPMRFSELNSLFRGVDNAFQVYANQVIGKLGEFVELNVQC